MKRRKALKHLGFGLSAGLILPQFVTACKKADPGPEVVYDGTVAVIGAGAAGLYAADILRSKGINVILLEAGSQMGGRVRSLRNQPNAPSQSAADFPVELGAEIIFGKDSILGKIIDNLHVNTVDLQVKSTNQFILGNEAKSGTDWGTNDDYASVQHFISDTLPNFSGSGVSVLAAAGVQPSAEALLNAQVGNFYGSTSSQIGAEGLSQGIKALAHDGKWLTMQGNPLQDLLLSRFSQVTPRVQLNTPVATINHTTDPVQITDRSGKVIEANKVIVTVPLSILKSNEITFIPVLPATMTSSLAKLGMDASIRVILDFKKNFWGTDSGFIWGGTTAPQYLNAGVGRSEFQSTLSITINGPKAVELSALDSDMITPILAELDAIYSGQATLYIRRDLGTDKPLSIIQDWSKDEFTKGGYSYPLINGTETDRLNIGAAVGTNLFFAGEATDIKGDAGTINGALASAERVAEEVVKSIVSPTV